MHAAYPNHGYPWIARYDPAVDIYLISERCEPTELNARDNILVSTRWTSEFRGMASYGIYLNRIRCDGNIDVNTDIALDYLTDSEWFAWHSGDFGGHVHSFVAGSDWCDYWGQTKINGRCGIHPSQIHIKTSRFLNYSTTTKINFFVHETSHSLGFQDYCGVDAITNNTNTSSCTLPSGYAPLDRQEMRDHIYPAWRYP